MGQFKEIQQQLNRAKKEKRSAQNEVFLFQEKLKQLESKKQRLSRTNRDQSSALAEIIAAQETLQRQIVQGERAVNKLDIDEANFRDRFLPFTDPREHIEKLTDQQPVLLAPVRLETRFKKVTVDNALSHQLWVRVFPDECSIDTFEDVPSESEIKKTKAYWASVWSAGTSDDELLKSQIRARQRAAWKALGGSVQAGRAYWLIANYKPLNISELPVRNNQSSVILSILTEGEVVSKQAVADYWRSCWMAQDNQQQIIDAFEDLALAVGGDDKARDLIGQYEPSNLKSALPPTVKVWYVNEEDEGSIRSAGTNEVILKILLRGKSVPQEKAALTQYWISFWSANGDPQEQTKARAALIDKVGSETRATNLISDYVPSNLNEFPFPEITVSFLQMPKMEETHTTQSTWSHPARVHSFPERFVLIGYKGEDSAGRPLEVLNEIGASIPDPLIIGPNPSIDSAVLLKELMVSDFLALTTTAEKENTLEEFYENSNDEVKGSGTKTDFINNFLSQGDTEIQNRLEVIFDQLRDDVKAAMYVEYLSQRSETKWLFDFNSALEVGMAFKINISKEVYENGFDRLFVLGVKLGADAVEGQRILEDLFAHHHYGNSGFSIVAQGTPTNNTEEEKSGFSEEEDIDETFERYFPNTTKEDPLENLTKRDGRWLTEMLGIDPDKSSLRLAKNYYHTDQCEARAINTALFNTTLGYFMESMITPVVANEDIKLVKSFFTEYVSGRGGLPSIRIGDQPYGILPISAIKAKNWISHRENNPVLNSKYEGLISTLQDFYQLLLKVRQDFDQLTDSVAYVGKQGDAHKILLKVLGLHATSVEYDSRTAQSFLHLFNRAKLSGALAEFIAILIEGFYKQHGQDLLGELGYSPKQEAVLVPILEKFFFTKANRLHKELIDDQPLSETKPIRGYTALENPGDTSENYIQWLIENARNNFDNIKQQKGFEDNKKPNTLLYQMLRQAIILGYSDTGFELYKNAQLLTPIQIQAAKIDKDFIGIKMEADGFENRWNYLDIKVDQITNEDLSVSDYISKLLLDHTNLNQTVHLREILQALEYLKDVPTARLERLFAEHMDCCSYRLDAWLLGTIRMQLDLMRHNATSTNNLDYNTGIYMGAYGCVENLRPDDQVLSPVDLPHALKSIFDPDNNLEILKDNNNGGYIHAPSINQSITASVLRNAYISNASKDNPETYKINLSSERVRMALSVIEGMQHGQSLGALLGYQLERTLHETSDQELDVYIYELRKVFPLIANHNKETDLANGEEFEQDKAVTKMEARNVVDGLALVNHILETKAHNYPFGFPIGQGLKKLKQADSQQRGAIDKAVDYILNINDALADLATAEGVHQVVQSNYDRASGTLETYSKGSFPQIPEVTRTPRSGVGLSHRVGIHLKSGVVPNSNSNPRVLAEPAIDEFIGHILPNLLDVACRVVLTTPSYGQSGVSPIVEQRVISIQDLELSPIDILYMVDVDQSKSLTSLDDCILKHIHTQIPNLRPDTVFEIQYTGTVSGKKSIFEISSLVKSLQQLIQESRPLKSSDLQLANETVPDSNANLAIDKSRVETTFDKFLDAFVDKTNLDSGLSLNANPIMANFDDEFIFNETVPFDTLVAQLDSFNVAFVDQLAELNKFGILEAGFGFVYDRKANIYGAIYQKVLDYTNRWAKNLEEFDALITESQAPTLNDQDKTAILLKAERKISTLYTVQLPTAPDPMDPIGNFEKLLEKKRTLFHVKSEQIRTVFLNNSHPTYQDIINALKTVKEGKITDPDTALDVDGALGVFDLVVFDTTAEEREIVILAEDMVRQLVKLNSLLITKGKAVQKLVADHDIEASPSKRVDLLTEALQLLFGANFKVIPEFEHKEAHKIEIQKSFDDKDQLLSFQLSKDHVDFPVDDWLYGVSRVREKMNNWESVVLLAESINGIELELSPLQFPYQENDSWLALDYPTAHEIESDKLLFTAYFRTFDINQKQCGLIIDEWSEVIPTKEETTGLSFQYDQPNTEPPQAMLLVTPSVFNGQWDWSDLVGSLHETLDMAKLRALEPEHIEKTAYAQFLPATISAVTRHQLMTFSVNFVQDTNLIIQSNNN